MKSIAIIGAGTLGKIIAEGVCSGAAGAWKLLGLTDCDEAGGRASAQKYQMCIRDRVCVALMWRSGGCLPLQISRLFSQRSQKRQPVGNSCGEGTVPGIVGSSREMSSFGRGMQANSPLV